MVQVGLGSCCEGRVEFVIAFLGGHGTAGIMRRAREAGIEVIEVAPKGPVVM